MADRTALGDRMKSYEKIETGRKLMPLLPICARIDGKNFSTFTRGLRRPYDERLSALMALTTHALVEQTQALIGYTQSDEISLVWYEPDPKGQVLFDGRVQKMASVLASMATAAFNAALAAHIEERAGRVAHFDCRVWTVPNLDEAANTLLWRELDAARNSVSMAARHYYSHKELHEQNVAAMQELLFQKGVNWNDYPAFFKRGQWLQRHRVLRPFTVEELDDLPPRHEARTNPDLVIERSEIRALDMPPFSRVTNRVAVIFEGADPTTEGAWREGSEAARGAGPPATADNS